MRLLGKICIITGASRGLGKHLAATFWEEGASLLLVAKNEVMLRDVCENLGPRRDPHQIKSWAACDLALPSAVSKIKNLAKELFPFLTVLVNNAAILGPVGPFPENNWMDWEETIRVNLFAPASLCAAVIPWMREKAYGKIINLSGGGATGPRPNFSAYATSKAGLVRLTEIIACELQGTGIDVNCMAPGALSTDMNAAVVSAGKDRVGEKELEEMARAQQHGPDVMNRAAQLAVFLASHESDGLSGRLISAPWDPWAKLPRVREILTNSDVYTLRRIVPRDRGLNW
jgi:3-oxoacyl-[acyl-carrier protein] reductase